MKTKSAPKKLPTELMTEQTFIAKFKKEGFGLYSTAGINATYKELEDAKTSYNKKCDELSEVSSSLYQTREALQRERAHVIKLIDTNHITSLNNSRLLALDSNKKESVNSCSIPLCAKD